MGRIISGGLEENNNIGVGRKTTQQPRESWLGYGLRNVVKTPALAYEMARSGMGLGSILDVGLRRMQPQEVSPEDPYKSVYDYLANYGSGMKSALQAVLPPTAQAGKEISSVLPQYMTEHRPSDWPAEFLALELPLIAATGGFSSLPAFGKSLARSVGMLGGATVGEPVGGAIGEYLGDEELGELLGGLAGGFLGGGLAHAVVNRLTPSKFMKPKISEKELMEYEAKKRKFEEEKPKRIAELPKPQEEMIAYDRKIEELDAVRKLHYDMAKSLEGNAKGDAFKIMNVLDEVETHLDKGMTLGDSMILDRNIRLLSSQIKNGTLTLADAKEFQKNFNDQIYKRKAYWPGGDIYFPNLSNPVKTQMIKIVEALNDFIAENSSLEHQTHWNAAEQATKDVIKLRNEKGAFFKKKNQQLNALNKVIIQIGGQTYEEFLNSQLKQKALEEKVMGIKKENISKWGLPGLGAVLGYLRFGKLGSALGGLVGKLASYGYNEYKIAKEVLMNHPEIFKEYITVLKYPEKMDAVRIANAVNKAGSKIEKIVSKEHKGKKIPGIISGGLED